MSFSESVAAWAIISRLVVQSTHSSEKVIPATDSSVVTRTHSPKLNRWLAAVAVETGEWSVAGGHSMLGCHVAETRTVRQQAVDCSRPGTVDGH